MRELNLDVLWKSGRRVRVRLIAIALIVDRLRIDTNLGMSRAPWDEPEIVLTPETGPSLEPAAVATLSSLLDFLADVTQNAADATVVEVSGFTPNLRRVPVLLGIEGVVPDPFEIELDR